MRINKCRGCKKNTLKKLFSLGDMCFTGKFPRKNQKIQKKPITLVLCKYCELVQLGHNFDLKYLYGPDYGYRTGINKTMLNHVRNVVFYLSKKTNLKKKDMVLDIASNDGSLLNFYKKNIKTFGIDPILNKYKKNYKNINYKIADFFSATKIKNITNQKFKIITALSVFYDAKDPEFFLKDVQTLLSRDGIFMLELADLHSILKYKMFDTICHEHLEYYSSKVIINLAKKNGLKVFDIKRNDINGGSKQFYMCLESSKYLVNNKILKNELFEEKRYKLSDPKTFKKFFQEINLIKVKLLSMIKKIKEKRQSIHCYGASTKGNVLLQYFGIDNKFIDFVAERNEKKYNLYTPGTKIKIISEKSSRSLKPDYYLVLPWHFKKEIVSREKEAIKKGTRFIFPLPKLNII
mgnify:FL=1|jgi:hypothetical protein|tara:strand:- start:1691 stop:2908 length:1218 start_codon:yes stop_codon:yes gene_type:complete